MKDVIDLEDLEERADEILDFLTSLSYSESVLVLELVRDAKRMNWMMACAEEERKDKLKQLKKDK